MSLQYAFQKQDTETMFNNHTMCDKENKGFQTLQISREKALSQDKKGHLI